MRLMLTVTVALLLTAIGGYILIESDQAHYCRNFELSENSTAEFNGDMYIYPQCDVSEKNYYNFYNKTCIKDQEDYFETAVYNTQCADFGVLHLKFIGLVVSIAIIVIFFFNLLNADDRLKFNKD